MGMAEELARNQGSARGAGEIKTRVDIRARQQCLALFYWFDVEYDASQVRLGPSWRRSGVIDASWRRRASRRACGHWFREMLTTMLTQASSRSRHFLLSH